MVTKFVVSLMSFALLLLMTACNQSAFPVVEVVLTEEEVADQGTTRIVGTVKDIRVAEPVAFEVAEIGQAEVLPVGVEAETLPIPYTPDMKVLFEEMALVQLVSDTYKGWVVTTCAGNGLNNIKPLPDGPMILIPNAGDLSIDGSNVSIKLNPDGQITFIPRVQGQKIQVPVDLGLKKAGEEVLSLTLDEAMRLMAAGKLTWTTKDQGPYGNGQGLPGHIAICDPIIAGQIADTPKLAMTTVDTNLIPRIEVPEAIPYTTDMKVLFEEMTLVQLISDTYKGWVVTACAGNGLNNIKPLPDGPMILIPNAGDLSINGSNVAIKLNPDGQIIFIPRVQGEKIRVPMDLGLKKAGEEVLSLTLDEAMRLMAAEKLTWTAKDQGPFGTGHGLSGHIATCDPRYDGR
jgi:hypothetical protein